MAELPKDAFRSSSDTPGDIPVEHEVEIVAENGNSAHVSGITDRRLARPGEASTASKSEKSSTRSSKARKFGQNNKLTEYAAKLLDAKVPLKKKQKLLNELAMVKDDGTVQFDVPGDIKPESLDFGTGVVYNGGTDEGPTDMTKAQDMPPPPLQIVMLIVGTRGDVQPFVAIGKRLQEDGHRVRLATHRNFKDFVLTAGLEFFPLGGDPKVLAGYMVKNTGFLPSGPSEIPIQRNQMKEIIFSLLPACSDPDPISNVSFSVDAIIANPPAYGLLVSFPILCLVLSNRWATDFHIKLLMH